MDLSRVASEFHFGNSNLTQNIILVLYLVLIEGLLSFDNALALAAMVKRRLSDPADQKKALTFGIWGAYIFRILIIFIGVWLMKQEWARIVAGLYLVYLAVNELFFSKNQDGPESAVANPASMVKNKLRFLSPLWSTIVAVELMDIMFSVDSIGVALALTSETWVLITGAILGIAMMRLSATLFIKLIDRFPVLLTTAFILVGIAGLNMLLEILGHHLHRQLHLEKTPLLIVLASIFLGSFVVNMLFPEKFKKH